MLPIGQRPREDRPNCLRPQALQRKDTAATHQSAGQSEIGILCRSADERDHPRLNVWQQHILLRLVEAVDLINKQAGALAVILQSAPCRLEHIAQLLHSGGGGRKLHEAPLCFAGNDLGQRRLAHPGGAVEDHRAEPISLDQPPQQRALPHHLLLPGVVVEPAGTHPCRQRRGAADIGSPGGRKQVGHANASLDFGRCGGELEGIVSELSAGGHPWQTPAASRRATAPVFRSQQRWYRESGSRADRSPS